MSSRRNAEEAWRSRVARHEDKLTTQTDDLIAEGIRAFTGYRLATKKGDRKAATRNYNRLTDLVEEVGTHPLMEGAKPEHRIRKAQCLCLTFFVSRDPKDLAEAQEIVNQLIREEDSSPRISHSAREILELIQELRA